MNAKTFQLSLVSLIIISGFAVAGHNGVQDYGLPSCWKPSTTNTMYGAVYEFADGNNNSDFFDETFDTNATDTWPYNSTIMTRLGIDSNMQRVYSLKYMNTSFANARGLAILFYNMNTSYFYAVFQYNGKVWGIPFLNMTVYGNSTWYSNSFETVLFAVNGTNITAVKESKRWSNTDVQYVNIYKFGNSSFKAANTQVANGLGGCAGACATYAILIPAIDEGLLQNVVIGGTPGAWTGLCFVYTQSGNSSAVTLNSNLTGYYMCGTGGHVCADPSGGILCEDDYEIDYWGCANYTGNVTFTAFEGSTTCSSSSILCNVDCMLYGQTKLIPCSGTTYSQWASFYPSFVNTVPKGPDCSVVDVAPDTHAKLGGAIIPVVYKDDPALYFKIFSTLDNTCQNEGITNFLDYCPYYEDIGKSACESTTHEQLFKEYDNVHSGWVIGYRPPGGNARDITLTSITFNTTIETNALKTTCEYGCVSGVCAPCIPGTPGCNCPQYNLTVVNGFNWTHFRKFFVVVNNGGLTITSSNSSSLASLLTAEQLGFADYIGFMSRYDGVMVGNKSVWIDYDNNFIGRFNLVWFDIGPDSSALYNNDIVFADNSNFNMTFNFSVLNISYVTFTGLPYADYQYLCTFDGTTYRDILGTSQGVVTVDQPLKNVEIQLQKDRPLWLELQLKSGNANASNAICKVNAANASYLPSPTMYGSGANGICNITNIVPESDFNVTVSYGSPATVTTGLFHINDYYNSEGCGVGGSCLTFDGGYEIVWDITKSSVDMQVRAYLYSKGDKIGGASVYWDGVLVGVTDANGDAFFQVPWSFCMKHNLTVSKSGYTNYSAIVDSGEGKSIAAPLTPTSPYSQIGSGGLGSTYTASLGWFNNPSLLGMVVCLVVGAVGFQYAGLSGGALGFVASAVLLATSGLLSFEVLALILLFAALLAAGNAKEFLSGLVGKRGG